ncbi:MAG: DUF1835 domain-containing protein [Bacteroidota bacterium]
MIFHILNGDALLDQFPKSLSGDRIVARECMVNGPLTGESLEELFAQRAAFLQATYGDIHPEDYQEKMVKEFEKLKEIPAGSSVHLWFEDDLFCQVNCWFCCYLLEVYELEVKVFLVRPNGSLQYGFGGMSTAALEKAYQDRQSLEPAEVAVFGTLWKMYRQNELDAMRQLAKEQNTTFPFLLPAVQAQIDRQPRGAVPGLPTLVLQQISQDLKTEAFGPIFQEFSRRLPIYGFGDLQVKSLYDDWQKAQKK